MASAATDPHITYRPDIDGLRAIAILAVLAFHTFPDVVHGGFVGVDVFFVISGYLITSVLLKGLAGGQFSLRQFYARRIRRIFPALALVALACLVAGWFLLLADEYTQLGKHVAATSAFGLNLVLWSEAGYFDTAAALKPLLHLWSLGVEEQFYIVWPLLLWLAYKRRIHLLALTLGIVAASFAYSVWVTHTNVVAAFYSPVTRFWELAVGCALARIAPVSADVRDAQSGVVANLEAGAGTVLVAAGVALVHSDAAFPGWWALLPTLGTGLLIAAGPQAWVNRRILSQRVLVWIGLISYPLYLWHWPLLSFARIQSSVPLTERTRLTLAVVSVVLAWLTYALVERRARRGHGAVAVGLALVMVAIFAAGASTFQLAGFPNRFPAWLRPYAAYSFSPGSNARTTTCWLSSDQPVTAFADECLDETPAHAGRPLLFIWGDSHAARLYVGMNQVYGDRYRLAQFTRDGCPPLALKAAEPCADGNRYVLTRIAAAKPAVVILFAFWSGYANEWVTESDSAGALYSTIASLRDLHVPRIIVVGPSPKWERELPRLVYEVAARDRRDGVPARLTTGLDPSYGTTESQFRAVIDGQPVTYFSIRDLLCNDEGCLTHVGAGPDNIVSFDYGHFTAPGAAYVAQRLPVAE